MKANPILLVAFTALLLSGCGGKTYYKNMNTSRNLEQDAAYCKSVAAGSVLMPNMQQYQNNATSYAPGSGTMVDQHGNTYRYQETYNPMAAAQSNMNMAQQNFANAAVSMQNLASQLDVNNARQAIANQCMAQLGWTQISKEEYDQRQLARKDPLLAMIQAAEQGDGWSSFLLAVAYGTGSVIGNKRVQQDPSQSIKWLQKSAEQGDINGQFHLGIMYRGGYDVVLAKDEYKAVELVRKAAERGYMDGQRTLGEFYASGFGDVPKDGRKALEWFKKAAEQGDPLAQNMIGHVYNDGLGVPKNKKQATEWYRKSIPGLRHKAEIGNAHAQYLLYFCLYEGLGVPKDKTEAVVWLKKAAEQGDGGAQEELSKMKQTGHL